MRRFLLLIAIFYCLQTNAQNKIVLNADKGKDTINKNIYGHFAEHLGHCIYGGFYVGDDNKKIPNKNGIMLDVVEALKKLKIPVLRWPGGCFADTYHWKDGIGPNDKRPSMINVWGGNVKEVKSFATNDVRNMCEIVIAEPSFSGKVVH